MKLDIFVSELWWNLEHPVKFIRILILQTLLFFFFPHPPIKTYVYKPIILPWSRD